jgi:rhodanese-related sulfurtransferase
VRRKTVDQLLAKARRRIEPRPDPGRAAAEVERDALLVDLRSVDERERHGVIPGSLHVPLSVLQWRADPTSGWTSPYLGDLGRRLILVCAEGYSSSLAAASLVELGYARATDLDGGFEAWRDAGLPIVPAPDVDGALPGMGGPAVSDLVPSTGERNSSMT